MMRLFRYLFYCHQFRPFSVLTNWSVNGWLCPVSCFRVCSGQSSLFGVSRSPHTLEIIVHEAEKQIKNKIKFENPVITKRLTKCTYNCWPDEVLWIVTVPFHWFFCRLQSQLYNRFSWRISSPRKLRYSTGEPRVWIAWYATLQNWSVRNSRLNSDWSHLTNSQPFVSFMVGMVVLEGHSEAAVKFGNRGVS